MKTSVLSLTVALLLVALLHGALSRPNGTISRSNGTISRPNGTISRPNDTLSSPNDTFSSPNDTLSSPNDTLSSPNDTLSRPNGTISRPNDTLSSPNDTFSSPNDTLSSPNDTLSSPNDTLSSPNDTLSSPNDTLSSPNDTLSSPNGTISRPNDTLLRKRRQGWLPPQLREDWTMPTSTSEPWTTTTGCIGPDGQEVELGQEVRFSECSGCTCTEWGMACFVADCVQPMCVDAVRPEGSCCYQCPNGPNCRIPDTGEIISTQVERDGMVCWCESQPMWGDYSDDMAAACLPLSTPSDLPETSSEPAPESSPDP